MAFHEHGERFVVCALSPVRRFVVLSVSQARAREPHRGGERSDARAAAVARAPRVVGAPARRARAHKAEVAEKPPLPALGGHGQLGQVVDEQLVTPGDGAQRVDRLLAQAAVPRAVHVGRAAVIEAARDGVAGAGLVPLDALHHLGRHRQRRALRVRIRVPDAFGGLDLAVHLVLAESKVRLTVRLAERAHDGRKIGPPTLWDGALNERRLRPDALAGLDVALRKGAQARRARLPDREGVRDEGDFGGRSR